MIDFEGNITNIFSDKFVLDFINIIIRQTIEGTQRRQLDSDLEFLPKAQNGCLRLKYSVNNSYELQVTYEQVPINLINILTNSFDFKELLQ